MDRSYATVYMVGVIVKSSGESHLQLHADYFEMYAQLCHMLRLVIGFQLYHCEHFL